MRMDQSWRGRPSVTDWQAPPCPGKFSTSSRATLVMRGGKGVMTLANGKRYAVILSSGDQKLVSISYIDG